MKRYRIKRVARSDKSSYYLQWGFLGLWFYMFNDFHFGPRSFNSYDEALRSLLEELKEPVVDYMDVTNQVER